MSNQYADFNQFIIKIKLGIQHSYFNHSTGFAFAASIIRRLLVANANTLIIILFFNSLIILAIPID